MTGLKTILLVCIAVFTAGELYSQIEAPDLECVRNDSLFWELPPVGCGTIEGYEIYASPDPGGPFEILDTVTNPMAVVYYHDNPAGDVFYYFLQTIADCPGQMPLSSDTLDNLPPPRSPIRFVSVQGSNVLIEWETVSDPDVVGYVVYRNTNVGTVPVDTVYSGNTYTDNGASPSTKVEYYYVNALDACGNASFFDQAHHTMLLDHTVDSCTQSAILDWTPYDTWPEGVSGYIIRSSVDGGPFVNVDTIPGSSTQYSLGGLDRNSVYEVEVLALRSNSDARSTSNRISFQPDIVQTVMDLNLFNADVQANDILLEWTWDPSAALSEVLIEIYSNGSNPEQTIETDIPSQGLSVLQQYSLTGLQPAEKPYSFELVITDSCGQLIRSGRINAIFLQGELQPNNNSLLNWNSLEGLDRSVMELDLFLTEAGISTQLQSLNINSTQATDNADRGDIPCYFVQATGEVTLADGSIYEFTQRSNEDCVARQVKVYMPNALAPLGVNNVYKPAIINRGSVAEYSLSIFDRWGNRVFFSSVPETGWDGRVNNERAAEGIYVYQLEIKQTDGNLLKRSGPIHLLY